jgi:aminotransferase
LRKAVADKIAKYNGIQIDVDARPFELMITNGGTGALIGLTQSYLRGKSALVFEPYYPYHRRILDEFGGKTESFDLDPQLGFEKDALLARCRALVTRSEYPLKAIIVCTPANPSGKVMTQTELEAVAEVAQELDLLVISDEVYEHYVHGEHPHIPIERLPGMWDRTITVNSFSKSWNISGWRLGYAIAPERESVAIRKVHDFLTVGAPAPLQAAAAVGMAFDPEYYNHLSLDYRARRDSLLPVLAEAGFTFSTPEGAYYVLADFSGLSDKDDAAFARWMAAEIGVAGVPGSSFYHAGAGRGKSMIRFAFCKKQETLDRAAERLTGLTARV